MWQVGDKAYCISTPPPSPGYYNPSGVPQQGFTYLVVGLNPNVKGLGLQLAGVPGLNAELWDCGWNSRRFRKLIPRSEREKARNVDCIANR